MSELTTWNEALDYLTSESPDGKEKSMPEDKAIAALKKAGYNESNIEIPEDVPLGIKEVYEGIEETYNQLALSAADTEKGGELDLTSEEDVQALVLRTAEERLKVSGCMELNPEVVGFMVAGSSRGSEFIADLLHNVKLQTFEKRRRQNNNRFAKTVIQAQMDDQKELQELFDENFVEAYTDGYVGEEEDDAPDLEAMHQEQAAFAKRQKALRQQHANDHAKPKKKLTQKQLVANLLANGASQGYIPLL